MKSVLVKGTKISFKIDKELIDDKTPDKQDFYYPNGIIDFVKENFDTRKKIITQYFHNEFELDNNEKCEILISFNEEEKFSLN